MEQNGVLSTAKVLIVDDEEPVRDLIGEILNMSGYDCMLAADAQEARCFLSREEFELVLCDINMPGESGLDFVRHVLAECPNTAAVMVTAMDDPLIAEDALKTGVYDYILKPFEPSGVLISVANAMRRRQLELDNLAYRAKLQKMVSERTAALEESEARLRAIFEAAKHVSFIMIEHEKGTIVEFSPGAEHMLGYSRREVINRPVYILNLPEDMIRVPEIPDQEAENPSDFTQELIVTTKSGEELPFMSTTYPIFNTRDKISASLVVAIDVSERTKAKQKLQDSMERLGKVLEGSINAMALTVEMRDLYTAGHQQRVADLASAIAEKMDLSEDRIYGIRLGGVIHDIGKISIPAEILTKPGRLNKIEFDLMKTHPKVGYDILKGIEFPWPIAKTVLQHHERINGSGYPLGLKGKEILLEARILGVADVVEAMASHRPYRPALGIDRALEEISKHKGILYDPEAVEACLRLFAEKGFYFD